MIQVSTCIRLTATQQRPHHLLSPSALPAALRQSLHLLDGSKYAYLSGEVTEVPGVDDAALFVKTRAGMDTIGLSQDAQLAVLKVNGKAMADSAVG